MESFLKSIWQALQIFKSLLQVLHNFRVTKEDGTVITEKRTIKGEFICSNKDDSRKMSHRLRKKLHYRKRCGYIVDLKPDLQMANVAEGVYLGSQDVAHDYDVLMQHKISHIINCATGVNNIFLDTIEYLTFDVLDVPWTNLEQHFEECHKFMRKAIENGGNVLVHCNAGISRSATIVLSYLMRYNKLSLSEALVHVNKTRKVCPNPGFIQQLVKYGKKLPSKSNILENNQEK
ncbi:unnamed protein product [Thelazia callipaeda]|uniref:Protein-serine/threonine phosphatase n=1 Tax=Thelazia callipaeda TaxID=103827 RepID=A0A0N5CZ93_THECL|nr:unnamed protein product [Thelazia callipaeda]